MSQPNVVAIFSGGLDSTVLLWHLIEQRYRVKALSFNYGQRHLRELDSAIVIAHRAAIPHEVVDLSALRPLIGKGSQTGDVDVPEGHYSDDSMRTTIVPNRNMMMLAVAAAHAITIGADHVAYAAHAGDHTVYPDCRAAFVEALNAALREADWHRVEILAPFLFKSKADIARLGVQLFAPLEDTWSCYKGETHHCGRCGTCVERHEAFEQAGVLDPTVYAP